MPDSGTTPRPAPIPHARVRVHAAAAAYDVAIGIGVLRSLGAMVRDLSIPRAFLAFDAALPDPLVDVARAAIAGTLQGELAIGPGESCKSLETVEALARAMALAGHERSHALVALGGGSIGDAAGLAASLFHRGTPLVHAPTTLLAMVDSSVGGKTGVNVRVPGAGLVKNLLGTFHPPRLVVADVDALRSLPDRAFASGLGECVKHALLGGPAGAPGGHDPLLPWLEANTPRILAREPATLVELVARNVAIKARVVEEDERETRGVRERLNLGHTFAHAIETLERPGEPALEHGEAVALGLLAACRASVLLGRLGRHEESRVRDLVERLTLPTAARGLPTANALLARMRLDKKTRDGRLRLVLPDGLGRCEVVPDPPESALVAAIDAIRA